MVREGKELRNGQEDKERRTGRQGSGKGKERCKNKRKEIKRGEEKVVRLMERPENIKEERRLSR